jgi:hypothetical protein
VNKKELVGSKRIDESWIGVGNKIEASKLDERSSYTWMRFKYKSLVGVALRELRKFLLNLIHECSSNTVMTYI